MPKKSKIIVIGGSSGMGLAIAKMMKDQGSEVIIASRSKEKLEKAKKAIGNVKIYVLDSTSEKELEKFFSSIGPFDHLVITAADFIMGPFLKLKTEEARKFFDSKFWGQYSAAKHGAPRIRKGGSITFFGGTASQKPMMDFAFGSAINSAIEGLARALALELAPIRVNAIAPGTIETPVWNVVPEKERLAIFRKTAEKLPVKRIGKPEDIAEVAAFLINCGFITGSTIYVDGGDHLI